MSGSSSNAPPPIGSGKLTSLDFVKEMVANGAKVNLPSKTGLSGRGILNKPGATPFLAAASTADVPLLGISKEMGSLESIALAQPPADPSKELKLDVKATFYPVVRQTFITCSTTFSSHRRSRRAWLSGIAPSSWACSWNTSRMG